MKNDFSVFRCVCLYDTDILLDSLLPCGIQHFGTTYRTQQLLPSAFLQLLWPRTQVLGLEIPLMLLFHGFHWYRHTEVGQTQSTWCWLCLGWPWQCLKSTGIWLGNPELWPPGAQTCCRQRSRSPWVSAAPPATPTRHRAASSRPTTTTHRCWASAGASPAARSSTASGAREAAGAGSPEEETPGEPKVGSEFHVMSLFFTTKRSSDLWLLFLPSDGISEEHANIWGTWHTTLKPILKDQSYRGKWLPVRLFIEEFYF